MKAASEEGDEASRSHVLAPAPPTKPSALKRLKALAASVPREADLVLVGDSLAAAWPDALLHAVFPEKRVFNFGLPGDRIQNTLWRLDTIDLAHLRPEWVILVIGTNNLGDGDAPEAIAAGVARMLAILRQMWADAVLIVATIPRRGPHGFRDPERLRLNRLIALAARDIRAPVIDADRALHVSASDASSLEGDFLHLSEEGYRRLTLAVAAGRPEP